tara:strand:- start:767 stop:892 length:126 start_codon:yes stop_codon:yes gene_type:complete
LEDVVLDRRVVLGGELRLIRHKIVDTVKLRQKVVFGLQEVV